MDVTKLLESPMFSETLQKMMPQIMEKIDLNELEKKHKEYEEKNNRPPDLYDDGEIEAPKELSKKSVVSEKDRDIRKHNILYETFNKKIFDMLLMLAKKLPKNLEQYKLYEKTIKSVIASDVTKPMQFWNKFLQEKPEREKWMMNCNIENINNFLADSPNFPGWLKCFDIEKNRRFFKQKDYEALWTQMQELLLCSSSVNAIPDSDLLSAVQDMSFGITKKYGLTKENASLGKIAGIVSSEITNHEKIMTGAFKMLDSMKDSFDENANMLPIPESVQARLRKTQE